MPITFSPATLGGATYGGFAAYRMTGGGDVPTTLRAAEGASCTFKAGEFVWLDTSTSGLPLVTDLVAKAAVNTWAPNTTTGTSYTLYPMLGYATHDATGTTGAIAEYILCDHKVEILTRVYNATAASSKLSTGTYVMGTLMNPGRVTGNTTSFVYSSVILATAANLAHLVITGYYDLQMGTVGTYGSDTAPTFAAGEQTTDDTYPLVWVRHNDTVAIS